MGGPAPFMCVNYVRWYDFRSGKYKPNEPALVKRLNHERLNQMFWALQTFLLLATIQQMALGNLSSALMVGSAVALLFLSFWLIREERYQLAAGRGGIRYYNTNMNNDAQAQVKLIADLRKALLADEFTLHYQSKIDLKTVALRGCGALLRWQHPTLGNVPPVEFVQLAERSGLIVEIGMWVMQQALHRFDSQGFGELSMAVNVSSLQFRRDNLDRIVEQALAQANIAPHRLEIEMTESMLMEPGADIDQTFSRLQTLGVNFSIDDFGTGYSNLGYLNKMKISILKIDRSFVSQIHLSPQDTAIVTAIIQMANASRPTVMSIEKQVAAAVARRFRRWLGSQHHRVYGVEVNAQLPGLTVPGKVGAMRC